MADVFLSYSSKDRAAARHVQQVLAKRGLDVFWDQETPPGTDWDTWTRSKLADARVAVVLWSKSSVASDSVRHEAMLARKADKLLPAVIDDLTPEDLPMGLYMVQSVVLTDWANAGSKGMTRLVAEVEARLGKPARAAPRPSPGGARGKSGMLLAAIAAVAVIGGGAAWWLTRTPGAPPAEASNAAAASGETFSRRMVGHWNWDGVACADGPNVTLEGGQLVFTRPDSRFVHAIETDAALETHTRVLEPEFVLGEKYVLTPEFNATKDERNFNLVLKNLTTGGKPDTWLPCEP